MRHQISAKEFMYLRERHGSRFCPWCLRKLAYARYSHLLASQIPPVCEAGYVEETSACSACGSEMNVFVNACTLCGKPGPDALHLMFHCDVARAQQREDISKLEVLFKTAEECEDDDGDTGPPPAKLVRGGLPSLGKKR